MKIEKHQRKHSFLALGDSYTIGELVDESQRWPNQLVSIVESKVGYSVFDPVRIIATTGWTTDELNTGIEKESVKKESFDFVSLLIGVNNQYRGYSIKSFESEFERLLLKAISFAKDKEQVFVLSIPDYGVTPFSREKNPENISKEIKMYNEVCEKISLKHQVYFFNITEISKKAANDISYLASDNLHPSGIMYKEWSLLISDWLKNQINK